MTFADAMMLTGLIFFTAGGLFSATGFYLKINTDRGIYLRSDQFKTWRPITPEEAARNHIPLTQHTDR